jgi:CysZ protein
MLDDATKALGQMLSPPLRAVLWKSIGLALALIVVVGLALNRLIMWLLGAGSVAVETGLGPHAHTPATAIAWLLSIAAGLGIVVGSVFLMPAVTAFVASFFADQIAEEVEREYHPIRRGWRCRCGWRCSKASGRRCSLSSSTFLRPYSWYLPALAP